MKGWGEGCNEGQAEYRLTLQQIERERAKGGRETCRNEEAPDIAGFLEEVTRNIQGFRA